MVTHGITPDAKWPHGAPRVTLLCLETVTMVHIMSGCMRMACLGNLCLSGVRSALNAPHTQAHARLTSSANPSVTGQVFCLLLNGQPFGKPSF
jgi:hypothetical protein